MRTAKAIELTLKYSSYHPLKSLRLQKEKKSLRSVTLFKRTFQVQAFAKQAEETISNGVTKGRMSERA